MLDPRVLRTRTAVLDVAAALLVEGGASAVTVEAIVQRSGVARSTIYRHWPSRADVVAAAFTRIIPPLPDPPPSGDVGSRLLAVLQTLAAQMAAERFAASVPAILDSTRRDPELAGFRRAFTDSQTRPLTEILHAAVAKGELGADLDVDAAVARLVGPMFFRRVVLDQPLDAGYADDTVRLFLREQARPPGPPANPGQDAALRAG